MVWVPPAAGEPGMPAGNGDTCHVVVEIKSHRPAFLPCAIASTVMEKRQQTNVIQTRVLRMIPAVWLSKYLSSAMHVCEAAEVKGNSLLTLQANWYRRSSNQASPNIDIPSSKELRCSYHW